VAETLVGIRRVLVPPIAARLALWEGLALNEPAEEWC
jgi:hypothetical protein